MLTNVPGVEEPLVVPPFGNSDHSFISFFVKIGFKIPNITLSRKMHLKSCADCPRVGEDLRNFNWSEIYNSPILVSELNKVITSLIYRRVIGKK